MGSSVLPSVRQSVRRHNLVSATPPTVFKAFWWNFLVIVLMTWRWSYFIEVMLDWFLLELLPFDSTFFNFKSCLCNSSCIFQLILLKPSSYCSHDLKRIILYRGHAWLLFTSYGPLSVLAILSIEILVSATPPTFFKAFWWNFPVIVSMT